MTTHPQDYTAGLELTLDPRECALLVIDVQEMFCSPTGVTGRKHANTRMRALPAKINAFAETFRRAGGLLVYLRALTDEANRPANMRWLDALKGVYFRRTPTTATTLFTGWTFPETR